MNRIVLVGNGFDLSCNLKTSYQDFIIDLIKQHCLPSHKIDQNDLMKIENNYLLSIEDLFKDFKTLDNLKDCENIILNPKSDELPVGKTSKHLKVSIKSNFLLTLLKAENWSNIENCYYSTLRNNFGSSDKVKKLNDDFQKIKDYFRSYIKGINKTVDNGKHGADKHKFIFSCQEYFGERDIHIDPRNPEPEVKPEDEIKELLFVNFNYTITLENLVARLPSNSYKYIPIHGTVSNDENDIIFGYGDDTHEDYKTLEQSGVNDYLINMKAFHYFFNNSYHELINFLKLDKYEIFVVGHSMGLSDRVLLKSIFEHNNCKAIRLFHRGNADSYFSKVLALSRHFDNKKEMRDKIVPYNIKDTIN